MVKLLSILIIIDGGEYRLYDSDSNTITRGEDRYAGLVRLEFEK